MPPEQSESFRVKFIVAGVQKAGTTSLHGYLCQHPELLAPTKDKKELHFFDNEQADWHLVDRSRYHRAFDEKASRGRLPFDVTPIYLFWPPALERIHRYDENVKLILIFRDPIERAFSNWRMEIGRGRENLPFHVAIRQGRWRLAVTRLEQALRDFSYVERGFYGRQVRRLLDLFPREQVLFLRSDDLRNDHSHVLQRIADFLGVEPFPTTQAREDHRTADVAYEIRGEDIAYLRDVYDADLCAFAEMTGLDITDWPTADAASEKRLIS